MNYITDLVVEDREQEDRNEPVGQEWVQDLDKSWYQRIKFSTTLGEGYNAMYAKY